MAAKKKTVKRKPSAKAELEKKFADLGIEVKPVNYKTLKALHLKGINIADLQDDDVMVAMMDVFINVYSTDEEQARLEPLATSELQDLFTLVMSATNEAEAKN